jgi:hypothetical protein
MNPYIPGDSRQMMVVKAERILTVMVGAQKQKKKCLNPGIIMESY